MAISDYIQIALWILGIGVTLLGALVLNIYNLNKNIAVIVVKVESHEKRIDRLENVTSP